MIKILQHKKEILISLLTGIFIFYIQPLLEYLGNLFVRTFVLISDEFSIRYYKSIANNDTITFSGWNSFMLNLIFSQILIFTIFYILNKKKEIQIEIKKTLERIEKSRSEIEKIDQIEEIKKEYTKEELLIEKNKLKEKNSELLDRAHKLKENAYNRDNKIIFFSIIPFFLIILMFTNYATMKSISEQNLIFKNDIIKITPFVKDSTVKIFYSDWARIQNSKDFFKLKNQLDSIKKLNKID